jgi:acyl carrier protein
MNTLTELKQLIHKSFDIDPETLLADAPLTDYGLDSLSLAELLFVVEDHFHIDFADAPKDVTTLAGLVTRIDELRIAQAA